MTTEKGSYFVTDSSVATRPHTPKRAALNYAMTDTDKAHLTRIANGDSLLATRHEVTLANVCLHYAEQPHGDEGFVLRGNILIFMRKCLELSGHDGRLLELAERLVPAVNPLALGMPYRCTAWDEE